MVAPPVADDKFIRHKYIHHLCGLSGPTATLQTCRCESQRRDLSEPVMYSEKQPPQHGDKVHGAGLP